MLSTYLTLAMRHLYKRRGHAAINIVGLAISIAACLVLWTYVRFETGYNSSFAKADRLYELNTTLYSMDMDPYTAFDVGPGMKQAVPGIKNFTRLHWSDAQFILKTSGGEKKMYRASDVHFADASFFDLFSFDALKGELNTALNEPYSMVMGKELASKFFANPADAVGNVIEMKSDWLNAELVIKAVVDDLPENSTVNFSSLVSIGPLIESEFYRSEPRWNNFFTFIELEDNSTLPQVNGALPRFIEAYKAGEKMAYEPQIFLQPIRDVHLSHRDPRQGRDMTAQYLFMVVSLIILAIAWVNYVNLSTARAMERAREVGIRKAIGVARKQLIAQFLVESFLTNLISIVLAVLLALLFMPVMEDMTGKAIALKLTDPFQLTILFSLLTLGTLASGIYPALMLSAFKTTEVIKGNIGMKADGFSLRKALIVFQFTASLCLLIGTAAIIHQVWFMQHSDKGIVTGEVLVVPAPDEITGDRDERMLSFKNALLTLPTVDRVATSGVVPGGNYNMDTHMTIAGHSEEESIPGENAYVIFTDMDFVQTYRMTLQEGRNWDPLLASDMKSVLINEASITPFGLKTAKDAIGEKVVLNKDTLQIIGVVKNYYWESLKVAHHPTVLYPVKVYPRRVSLHLKGDVHETIRAVAELYDEYFPGNTFDYYFADDYYNRMYQADVKFGAIFVMFATLAMVVACMGLFGLATFTIQQRGKEISIRKILGASVSSIMTLLSAQFGRLLLMSILISIPLSWLAVSRWLESYPVKIGISFWLFVVPSVFLLFIAMVSVMVQVYRGANANPSNILRGS